MTGRTGLSSPLAVEELVLGAVAAQLLAAREVAGQRLEVTLEALGVGFAFRSERHARHAREGRRRRLRARAAVLAHRRRVDPPARQLPAPLRGDRARPGAG